MSVHGNSIQARIEAAESLSARAAKIHRVLARAHDALTDRQVARLLGFADMNCVRPRITELIADGWADEVGGVRCDVTGKRVRLVRGRSSQRVMDPDQMLLI